MNHTDAGLLNTKNRDSPIHLYSSQLRVSAQTSALFVPPPLFFKNLFTSLFAISSTFCVWGDCDGKPAAPHGLMELETLFNVDRWHHFGQCILNWKVWICPFFRSSFPSFPKALLSHFVQTTSHCCHLLSGTRNYNCQSSMANGSFTCREMKRFTVRSVHSSHFNTVRWGLDAKSADLLMTPAQTQFIQ